MTDTAAAKATVKSFYDKLAGGYAQSLVLTLQLFQTLLLVNLQPAIFAGQR